MDKPLLINLPKALKKLRLWQIHPKIKVILEFTQYELPTISS